MKQESNYAQKLPSTLESNLRYLLKTNDLAKKDWAELLEIINIRLNNTGLKYNNEIPIKRPKNFYKIDDKEILKTRVRISSSKRFLKEFASKVKLEDYKELIEKKIKNSSDEGIYQKKLSALYKNYEQKLQGTELIKFY